MRLTAISWPGNVPCIPKLHLLLVQGGFIIPRSFLAAGLVPTGLLPGLIISSCTPPASVSSVTWTRSLRMVCSLLRCLPSGPA